MNLTIRRNSLKLIYTVKFLADTKTNHLGIKQPLLCD